MVNKKTKDRHSMSTIYNLIRKDHNKHRTLLKKIAQTHGDTPQRRELWQRFYYDVKAHAAAEEETLYAEMMRHPEGQPEARHSVSEHKELDDLMEALNDMPFSNPHWLQKFKTLRHDYLHHINEEENEILPQGRKLLGLSAAKLLGAKFTQRKPAEVKRVDQKAEEKLTV